MSCCSLRLPKFFQPIRLSHLPLPVSFPGYIMWSYRAVVDKFVLLVGVCMKRSSGELSYQFVLAPSTVSCMSCFFFKIQMAFDISGTYRTVVL